jgi:hypothetical protein
MLRSFNLPATFVRWSDRAEPGSQENSTGAAKFHRGTQFFNRLIGLMTAATAQYIQPPA